MRKIFTFFAIFAGLISLNVYGQASHVTISQIFGGGGNTGAPFTNDYVELYNPTNVDVDISNWQIAYASAIGSSWTNKTRIPNGTILPSKKYYLIQEGAGAATPAPLPTPDLVPTAAQGVINMSGTAGKVALVTDTTTLSVSTTPTPVINPSTSVTGVIVDFVAYGLTPTTFEGSGPATAPSNSTSIFRAGDGSIDTDDNKADFASGTPNPRSLSTVLPIALKSFNASLINNQPVLRWQTANEANFSHFAVEKSTDAKNFTEIAKVSSNTTKSYEYIDYNKTISQQYYRLKMVDTDGKFTRSAVVAVSGKEALSVMAYPNPVTDYVVLSHPKAGVGANIRVLSTSGKQVINIKVSNGATQTSFDVQKLTKAGYLVVFDNNGVRQTTQLIKQ